MSKQNNKSFANIRQDINQRIIEECSKWPYGKKEKKDMLKFLLHLAEMNIFPIKKGNHVYIKQMTKCEGNLDIQTLRTLKPTKGYICLNNNSVGPDLKKKGFDEIPIEMVDELYTILENKKNPAYIVHKQMELLRQNMEIAIELLKEFKKLTIIEQRLWIKEYKEQIGPLKDSIEMNIEYFKRLSKEQQQVWIDAYVHQLEITKSSIKMDIETFNRILKVVQEKIESMDINNIPGVVQEKIKGIDINNIPDKLKKITGPNRLNLKFTTPIAVVLFTLVMLISNLEPIQKPTSEIEVGTENPDGIIPIKKGTAPSIIGLDLSNRKSREKEEAIAQLKAERALAIYLEQKEYKNSLKEVAEQQIEAETNDVLPQLVEENSGNYMRSIFVNINDSYETAIEKMSGLINNQDDPSCVFIRVKNTGLSYKPSTIVQFCCDNGLHFQFVLLSECTDEDQAKAEADMLKAEIDKIPKEGYKNNFLGSTVFLMYDSIHPERDPQQVGKDYTQLKQELLKFIRQETEKPLYLFSQSVYDLSSGIGIIKLKELVDPEFVDGALVLEDNRDPELEELCDKNGVPIIGKFNKNWQEILLSKAVFDYITSPLVNLSEEERAFLKAIIVNDLQEQWTGMLEERINKVNKEFDKKEEEIKGFFDGKDVEDVELVGR